MCDYSLQTFKSRPAKVADKLITKNFGRGTTGFADVNETDTAVCVLPGTEIAFDFGLCDYKPSANCRYKTAIFRQVNKDQPSTHHDQLELPDGTSVMLTQLMEGQIATILQLPAAPRNEKEIEEQTRVPVVA